MLCVFSLMPSMSIRGGRLRAFGMAGRMVMIERRLQRDRSPWALKKNRRGFPRHPVCPMRWTETRTHQDADQGTECPAA